MPVDPLPIKKGCELVEAQIAVREPDYVVRRALVEVLAADADLRNGSDGKVQRVRMYVEMYAFDVSHWKNGAPGCCRRTIS